MAGMQTRGRPKAAMLHNVQALLECASRLTTRAAHLDGLGVMYGPSGFGKSVSATVVMSMHDAVYAEARPSWTRRELVETLAQELGVQPASTIARTTALVGQELALSQRLVILDEADVLVARGLIETVRELYMTSGAPIILIGEEKLPKSLEQHERVHNRVLSWVPAMPATLADARALAAMYVPNLAVADDLLAHLVERGYGRVRRIVVNLDRVAEEARNDPPESGTATRGWWGGREVYTGQAPVRRVV